MNGNISSDRSASVFSLDRLSSLNDGVFAVAMTLLAYNVRVPHGTLTTAQLHEQLGVMAQDLYVLFNGFVAAALFWRVQVKLLDVMRHAKRPPVSAALVFLFFVVLLPITTGLTGAIGDINAASEVASLFMGNLTLLAFTQLGLWLLVLRGRLMGWRVWWLYLAPSLFSCTIFLIALLLSFRHLKAAAIVFNVVLVWPLVWRFAWQDKRMHPGTLAESKST